MRMRLVLIALVTLGCVESPPDDTGLDDTGSETDTGVDSNAASDLAAAQTLWATAGLEDYDYVLEWHGMFGPDMAGPATILVRGGTVQSATYTSDGSPVTADFDARSIEGLFAVIQEGLDAGADQITASYDETRGYPTYTYVDYDLEEDDEEHSFSAAGL